MQAYLPSIRTALSIFPLIAILLTVPYILHSYRRYGAVSRLRTLILFSFILYMLCANCLVILPLPGQPLTSKPAQLIPLRFIHDFSTKTTLRLSDPSTFLPALGNGLFLQPVFNVCLTIPFGLYLAYYFRQDKRHVVLLSFALTLFFEVSQLTGLFGRFPKGYRLFDVDDLLLNTLGGYLGYLLGCKVSAILPTRQAIDAENLRRGKEVSALRRLTATIIDCALLGMADICLCFFVPIDFVHGFAALALLYFIGLQSRHNGRTVGKALVGLRLAPADGAGHARFPQVTIRYVLPIGLGVLSPLALITLTAVSAMRNRGNRRPLWYERITGTTVLSRVALNADTLISI